MPDQSLDFTLLAQFIGPPTSFTLDIFRLLPRNEYRPNLGTVFVPLYFYPLWHYYTHGTSPYLIALVSLS
jgi:hypothetical protein